ncbi:hypothetical protein [Flagellimonas meishanensis]|uniref:hypothetical protein n=1 Tax=Flagellimonas meishanensis TaxID=2873264 RepID=UPI001CA776D7|nr:hypothetical protein [[Muricauda] meishanensis]
MESKSMYPSVKKRNGLFRVGFILMALCIFMSCSGDKEEFMISLDGPNISVSDFTGSWEATTSVFESTDGSQRLDVIEVGGTTLLQVQNNGRFTITIAVPGQGSESFSGKMGFNGDEYGNRLIVLFDGDAMDDYELFNVDVNNDETLFLSGITTFDFTGSGTEVLATIDLVMVRS